MQRLSYNFRGFVVPVFTPFDGRYQLNLSIIPKYAEYLSHRGIKGVLVGGTTGEGPSMSLLERKQLTKAWVDAVKTTKQHVMIQVGGAPLPDVIELARYAEEMKVDSLLCLPELYFKPTDAKQLIEYLKIVGEAAPSTPLLYYHIPMFTNVSIHMGKCLEVVGNEIPTFVGIKFTSNNLEEGAHALSAGDGKFVIFLGNDQLISPAIAMGMDSFIATSINILPELGLQIADAGKKGDFAKAKQLQEKLSQAVIAISKYGNWVSTMKEAMTFMTPINLGSVRAPLQPLPREKVESMKKDLVMLGYKAEQTMKK